MCKSIAHGNHLQGTTLVFRQPLYSQESPILGVQSVAHTGLYSHSTDKATGILCWNGEQTRARFLTQRSFSL